MGEVYARNENPSSRLVIVMGVLTVFLYGFGVYGVLMFFVFHPELLSIGAWFFGFVSNLISRNLSVITLLLLGLIGITIVSVPLIIRAMARFGRKVMVLAIFAPAVFIIAMGLITMVVGFVAMPVMGVLGLVMTGVGGLLLLWLFRQKKRVELAGEIFELSARAVATEMGTLVPSIAFGLFSIFNVAMAAGGGFMLLELLARANGWIQGIAVFLMELGYAWLLFSTMYLADGTIIGIVNDWYRNPTEDRASLGKGFAAARRMIGPILQFAFVMALLSTVARTARNKAETSSGPSGIAAAILALVSAIAQGIVQFITYFALPAMVIEGTGFRDSVKSSYSLVWRRWIDVVLAYMGIDGTYTLFMIAMLAIYGASGGVAGWLLIAPAMATSISPIFVSLFSVFAFILFGFIPAYVLFRPIKVAYNTILYDYAKDEESGNQLPSRMTVDLRQHFQGMIAMAQRQSGMRRWQEPKFPEVDVVGRIRSEVREARTEGLTKYVRSEIHGEVRQGEGEAGLTNNLCGHLQQIGLAATFLEGGIPGTVEGSCIRVDGRNINFIQVQTPPNASSRSGELRYQYSYVVQADVAGLEGKLRAEVKPPAYWKLDLAEKRIVDFQWNGELLAQQLNSDSELKAMLLRGGLDRLVIIPSRERRSVRIVHTPGTWPPITIGQASIPVGREAFPSLEDFEAYDRIAQHIRDVVEGG